MTKIANINNDTDFLTLMNEVLTDRGWQTVVCRESNIAHTTIKEENPDLVILDIRMESPESGWNVLELLKLDRQTRDLPVIVCSAAAADLAAREEWLRAHGVYTLPKPFDLEDLYGLVERVLPG